MPVKIKAMQFLKGWKDTFYCDQWGPSRGNVIYEHQYVDFYPAERVEKLIDDLSKQVLEERRKWTAMWDKCKTTRRKTRDACHAAILKKDKEIKQLKTELDAIKNSDDKCLNCVYK